MASACLFSQVSDVLSQCGDIYLKSGPYPNLDDRKIDLGGSIEEATASLLAR